MIKFKSEAKKSGGVLLSQSTLKIEAQNQQARRATLKNKLKVNYPNLQVQQEYDSLFSGFAVSTTASIDELSVFDGVAEVFPVQRYQLSKSKFENTALLTNKIQNVFDDEELLQGKSVKIAIIDSGINFDHPMFDDTGMEMAHVNVTDDFCRTESPEFCNNKIVVARHYVPSFVELSLHNEFNSPRALNGHGTHVAAIAAGRKVYVDEPFSQTIQGKAPGAQIMVYKAMWGLFGVGTDVELLKALEDAYKDGADIINNSWGGQVGFHPDMSIYQSVFHELEQAGVLLVSAAGNSGEFGERTIGCPACIEAGIAVASVDRAGDLSSFSSRGPNGDSSFVKPDISAYGEGVLSATSEYDYFSGGKTYERMNGTSMASPQVAGAAALVKQANPDFTAEQLKAAILASATLSAETEIQGPLNMGVGQLNVEKAIEATAFFATPNLVLENCIPTCNITSQLTVKNKEAKHWVGEIIGDRKDFFTLSPNQLTFDDNVDKKLFLLTASLPLNLRQDWYQGFIKWTNQETGEYVTQGFVVNNEQEDSELIDVKVSNSGGFKKITVSSSNITDSEQLDVAIQINGGKIVHESLFSESNISWQAGDYKADTSHSVATASFKLGDTTLPFDIDLIDQESVKQVSCREGCDEFNQTIRFNFDYLGKAEKALVITDNGIAVVGSSISSDQVYGDNYPMPFKRYPNAIIAPFWTDFDLKDITDAADSGFGKLLYMEQVHQGRNYLIVQWHQVQLWIDESRGYTPEYYGLSRDNIQFKFQLIIEENSDNIWFNYMAVPEQVKFYSVGMEDETGLIGYQHWFNDTGVARVNSGDVVKIEYQQPEKIEFSFLVDTDATDEFANPDEFFVYQNDKGQLNVLANDFPSADNATVTIDINNRKQITPISSSFQSQLDHESLTIVQPAKYGQVVVLENGIVEYENGVELADKDTFTYQVANEQGEISVADVIVNVLPNNPILSQLSLSLPKIIEDNSTVAFSVVTSLDGDLQFNWQLPDGLSASELTSQEIDVSLGHLMQPKDVEISVIVTYQDEHFELTQSVRLMPTNDAPSDLTITGPMDITEGEVVSYTASAIDLDSELNYQWQVTEGLRIENSNTAIAQVSVIDETISSATITVVVSDGEFEMSESQTISIHQKQSGGAVFILLSLTLLLLTRRQLL